MLGLLALMGIALALLLALMTAMMAWQMVHPSRRTAAWALARGLPSDPSDLNLTFDEWWLDRSAPHGVRLSVWEVDLAERSDVSGQKAAEPSRSHSLTAVFVHGWGHGRVNSLQRIEPFRRLFDRIVLYDLRGHGDAIGSTSTLGDGDDDDLLALLDRLGEGPFVLVGHSMGAVIALRAAAKVSIQHSAVSGQHIQKRIAGVIAYGPYCDFHQSLRGRLGVHGYPARPMTDLALLVHRMRGVRPRGVEIDSIKSLDMPLLVVHGAQDRISPVGDARAIAQAARDAVLIEVDDAAHTDSHSVDQDAHDRAVRAFVERLRAGHAYSLK